MAVLQVLKQDKMPLLYSLVFGEGVINDATSVALLRAVQVVYPTLMISTSNVKIFCILQDQANDCGRMFKLSLTHFWAFSLFQLKSRSKAWSEFGAWPHVQALKGTEVLNASTVVAILAKFLYLFVASMGLGLAFGLGTSWLMKIFKSNSTPQVTSQPRQAADSLTWLKIQEADRAAGRLGFINIPR